MDQIDAYRLLDEKASEWQEIEFGDLVQMIGEKFSDFVKVSGQNYEIESAVSRCEDDDAINIDLMIATAGNGPLQRIDRTISIKVD